MLMSRQDVDLTRQVDGNWRFLWQGRIYGIGVLCLLLPHARIGEFLPILLCPEIRNPKKFFQRLRYLIQALVVAPFLELSEKQIIQTQPISGTERTAENWQRAQPVRKRPRAPRFLSEVSQLILILYLEIQSRLRKASGAVVWTPREVVELRGPTAVFPLTLSSEGDTAQLDAQQPSNLP